MDELGGLIARLDSYLAQGLGRDLQQRLHSLEQAGSDVELIKTLEGIISRHGLVEFRAALSALVDRLESGGFDIAVFGRVRFQTAAVSGSRPAGARGSDGGAHGSGGGV